MNDLTKRTFDDVLITPEYIKRKIKSDKPFSPVVIDALTFICHAVPRDVIEETLSKYLDPFNIPLKTGFMGFTRGKMTEIGHSVISYDPSEASLRQGKYYNSSVCYVTITGHDCAFINKNGSMEALLKKLTVLGAEYPLNYINPVTLEEVTASGIEFKRIDLAKDCFDDRFNFLLKLEFPASQIVSKNNEAQWLRKTRLTDYVPGWTLYFGTREKSSCFVRLYDKRVEQGLHKPEAVQALGFDFTDWVRLEFECKKALPQKIVARLTEADYFYLELSAIYEELAKKYFGVKSGISSNRPALSARAYADFFLEFIAKEQFCE